MYRFVDPAGVERNTGTGKRLTAHALPKVPVTRTAYVLQRYLQSVGNPERHPLAMSLDQQGATAVSPGNGSFQWKR